MKTMSIHPQQLPAAPVKQEGSLRPLTATEIKGVAGGGRSGAKGGGGVGVSPM